ncbi:hypothetical protein M9H77_00157 [Catharanthus roseus]|nr:hypothetical protein M9H77_00157 [Catharanthus roseus]
MQQLIKGLARQFKSVAKDTLKKGKSTNIPSSRSVVSKAQASTQELITNPIKYFKGNGVGHIAINCRTKRTLVFSEDLNGWIEKSEDDCQEGIVDQEESSETKRLPLLKPMKRI